jgi:sec-independent protein translocase protein TatA
MIYPLFLNLGTGEIFIIVIVIIMFFGADKLPEMVRTFSRSMNQMKDATTQIQKEIQNSTAEIQREMNATGALDDLKEGAQELQKRILEGTKIEDESTTAALPERPEDDPDNPHKPEDSFKRD